MKDLYFKNKEELELFLQDKIELGKGAEGTCYKVEDFALKIYEQLFKDYKRKTNISNYTRFKDIDVPNFNFIKNSAYITEDKNDYIVGTISKFVEGTPLKFDTLYYTPIDELIESIKKLLSSINKLSRNSILVGDVFVNNIIYNNGEFHFIDTASYEYSYEEPYYIYKNNVKEIVEELIRCITNSYKSSNITMFLRRINGEFDYSIDRELLFNPIYLLNGLKKSLEEYCDQEIKSFSDCEKKLIKKMYN